MPTTKGNIVKGGSGDPFEYKRDGDNFYYRKSGSPNKWQQANKPAAVEAISGLFPEQEEAASPDPYGAGQYVPDFPLRDAPQQPTLGPLAGGQPAPQAQQQFQAPDISQRQFAPEQTRVDVTRVAQSPDISSQIFGEPGEVRGKDFRSNEAYRDYAYFENENGTLMFKSSPSAKPKKVTSKAALKEYKDYVNAPEVVESVLPNLMEAQADPEVDTEKKEVEEFLPKDKKNRWIPASVKAYKAYMDSAVMVGEGRGDEVKTMTEKTINPRERKAFRDIVAVNLAKDKAGKIDYRDYSDDEDIANAPSSGAALDAIKSRGAINMMKNSRLGLSNFVGNASTYRTKDGDVIVVDDYNFNPSQDNPNLKPGITSEEFNTLWEEAPWLQGQKEKGADEGAWASAHFMGDNIKSSVPVEINLGHGSKFLSMDDFESLPLAPEGGFNHVRYDPFDYEAPEGGDKGLGLVQKGVSLVRGKYSPEEETTMRYGGDLPMYAKGGGLSRKKDYGSKKKPYPSVKSKDFAGGGRSYPIPTRADAVDALRLAGLHGRSDVRAKVYRKYPGLKKKQEGGYLDLSASEKKSFAEDAAAMGHTIEQHAAHVFQGGGSLPEYQWGGQTFGTGSTAVNLGTSQLAGRHEDLKNLKYLDLPDTDWGSLAMNVGGAALSAYGGAGGTFGGAIGEGASGMLANINPSDIAGIGSSMMGASSGNLAGANVVGGGYGGFDMGAMGGLAAGQYMQRQTGIGYGQDQMTLQEYLQQKRLKEAQEMSAGPQGLPGSAAGPMIQQMGANQFAAGSQPYPVYTGGAGYQDGGQLESNARERIEISQDEYNELMGGLVQEEQEGYYPVYQEGGQLMGYLPEYGFGSWLGDNAGKILKGVGGVVSVIPGFGQVAGPILIGAGYATDAIVGAVRKNRAEEELAEATKRENEAAAKRAQTMLQAKQFDPTKNIDYGATFEAAYGGDISMMMQGGQSQQPESADFPKDNEAPVIVNYDGDAPTHEEGVGGVPVDAKGNPSVMSKQSAVGLTEKGEVTWNGYVFSDKLTV